MHLVGERVTLDTSESGGWNGYCSVVVGVMSMDLRHRLQNNRDLQLDQIHVAYRTTAIVTEIYHLEN